jgi:NADH:ubiquinone oxidoreductase subunit 3 (subunit A)
MDTYHVVLYLHFLSLFLGVGGAAVIGVCLFRLRAAQTLADAAPFGMLAGQTERVFPVAILGLFATGAYMTSDVWTWSTSWIEVSMVGLVLVALQGPLLAGRRAHALKQALMENGPGPLGERARRLTRDPILWIVTFVNPAIVFAIAWNMTEKPGTAGSIASVVVAYAVGAGLAWPFTKARSVEAVAAPTSA